MARFRTPNFHNARLSVAQSAIREHVARRTPGAAQSGLFASHPLLQAASTVLERIDRGEIADAQTASTAYNARRVAQAQQGVALPSVLGTMETCMDLLVHYVFAWAVHDTHRMNQIRSEWKTSPCDVLGWMEAVDAWLAYYWLGAQPKYNPPVNAQGNDQPPFASPGTFDLPPAASGGALRVGVLGDWGTGEPEAIAVLDQLMLQRPDLIIHVGDTYYAGTVDEQHTNFLEPINAARARHGLNIPVYALPGNHDYYSGGAAFYQMIQQLNAGVPNASTQFNSFWALVNDAWQLEGMDTGFHDSDLLHVGWDTTHLRTDEAAWHQQQLKSAGSRTVILFSHHQLFSTFEPIGQVKHHLKKWENPQLLETLAAWRDATSNITAWFWGHEHVLEVYEVPGSLPILGRCIGNGAFPVFTDSGGYKPNLESGIPLETAKTSPDGTITFPSNFVQSQPDDQVWASGYSILELPDSGDGTASYYQVMFNGGASPTRSALLWTETIPAAS